MSEPSTASSVRAFLMRAAVHILLWGAFGAEMLYFMPLMKKTYMEYGLQLSTVTQYLIAVSDWFASYWYVVCVGPLLADAVVLTLLHVLPVSRRVRLAWSITMLLCLFAFLLWGVVSYVLDMGKRLEGLSK